MAIILTPKKNGKGWYRDEMVRPCDVPFMSGIDNMSNSALEKKYRKVVKNVGLNPKPETKQALVAFRFYINQRYKEGVYVFGSKAEKKKMRFCKSLV